MTSVDRQFQQFLALMRKRDPGKAEDGFHRLLALGDTCLPQLFKAYDAEPDGPIRYWLLELIGSAKSEAAFSRLCDATQSDDEAIRSWGVWELKELDSKAARRFLYEMGEGGA